VLHGYENEQGGSYGRLQRTASMHSNRWRTIPPPQQPYPPYLLHFLWVILIIAVKVVISISSDTMYVIKHVHMRDCNVIRAMFGNPTTPSYGVSASRQNVEDMDSYEVRKIIDWMANCSLDIHGHTFVVVVGLVYNSY
jgi:hypothetical protein